MNQLKRKAQSFNTRHEFMAEIMRWYRTYTRRYPVIKTWNKADLYAFYEDAKRTSNRTLGRVA